MGYKAFTNNENIITELNLLLMVIPDDLTVLEKIRYIYIKMGQLFSYNYDITNDDLTIYDGIDFSKDIIAKYQTCIQISQILNIAFNNIAPKDIVTSKIIPRKISARGYNTIYHVANEVIIKNPDDVTEKYLFDLTLDLYLIQSGCQTKQFGYTTDENGTYDIIPLSICEKMDRKLGLIQDNEYTDAKIKRLKNKLNLIDYTGMSIADQMIYRITALQELIVNFSGHQEGKLYMCKLFNELLPFNYKEYNLTYSEKDVYSAITCFCFSKQETELWYIYNNRFGLIATKPSQIEQILKSGWKTNSHSLNKQITK